MNEQQAEKRSYRNTLDVFKVFPTIQGEGPHVGRPAIFVRLAGCNLQCPLCDTDYTSQRRPLHPLTLIQEVDATRADMRQRDGERLLVVVTGGEPLRQDLAGFVNALVRRYDVQIETNGTLTCYGIDTAVDIVCSPKTGNVASTIQQRARAWKYVARADHLGDDGLPQYALDHPASPRLYRPPPWSKTPIYLQPADEGNADANRANLDACIDSCMRHGYILGVQLHKIIGRE